jgi:hypothetical protein
MVYQKHREDFPKTSKWFTEDIEKIFFHFRQICIFLAESRLKDAPFQSAAFIHKYLQVT